MPPALLFVFPSRPGSRLYVLGWSTDGGRTYTPAEGGPFRTMREVRAYGLRRFGERARRL